MEIIKLTQDQLDSWLTPEGQSNASGSFRLLREGRMPTKRTPLYKNLSQEEVFEKWFDILAQYEGDDLFKPLIKYDKSRMSKVGPQGGYPPFDDRKDDFEAYYTTPIEGTLPIDQDIIREMRSEIFQDSRDKRPLRMRSVVERDLQDDKLDTNSGAPDFAKKSLPLVYNKAIKDSRGNKYLDYPMILSTRSSRGKARFIFMAPFSLTLVEKSYLYPIMDAIRKEQLPFFSAWEGFEQVEQGFKAQNFFKYDLFVQQDYTAMDKSVNDTIIEIFYQVCAPLFQEATRHEFRTILDHMLTVPIMTSLDKAYTGKHGLPSGSGFTNIVESIASYYIWKLNVRNGVNITEAQGLGDDLAFAIRADNPDDSYIQELKLLLYRNSMQVGLLVEPEKQGFDSNTLVYLQRFFDKRLESDGVVLGMYPSILALNTAMNPERFHDARKWSSKMEILRWIMILENCKNLPYFEDLVQFFIEGDLFKLGLSDPEFFVKLPSLYENSKAIKGFVPTYNQASINRGIYDFATFKYLLKLRDQLN